MTNNFEGLGELLNLTLVKIGVWEELGNHSSCFFTVE
jgi:hypothetical protein